MSAKNPNFAVFSEPKEYLGEQAHTFSYIKDIILDNTHKVYSNYTRKNYYTLQKCHCAKMPHSEGVQYCRSASPFARKVADEFATSLFVLNAPTRRNSACLHIAGKSAIVSEGSGVTRFCSDCAEAAELAARWQAADKCARASSATEHVAGGDRLQKPQTSQREQRNMKHTYDSKSNIPVNVSHSVETSLSQPLCFGSYCAPQSEHNVPFLRADSSSKIETQGRNSTLCVSWRDHSRNSTLSASLINAETQRFVFPWREIVLESESNAIVNVECHDQSHAMQSESISYTSNNYPKYSRRSMLGVRDALKQTKETCKQTKPMLKTIQNERLIRFVEACIRKLNKKHDRETLNLLRGGHMSEHVNKHTYKSNFVNTTKKQKRRHTKATRQNNDDLSARGDTSVTGLAQQRWPAGRGADATSPVGWEWEGRGRSPTSLPNSPGGVGAGASTASLDAPLLGPDWTKIGLSEYQRKQINIRICASKTQLVKNTRAELRRRHKEANAKKQEERRRRRNIKEQIRISEAIGQNADRGEGEYGVKTPRAAKAAEREERGSREREREPEEDAESYLLRFGGSATGGSAPPVETKESAGTTQRRKKARNTKRGLRSRKAVGERNVKRTAKRRVARRKHRCMQIVLYGGGDQQGDTERGRWASAQEPDRMDWKEEFWIATLNVDGLMRQGKREEVETWMKKHDIKILVLQETHSANNSREARGNYTWFFSGEKKQEGTEWSAGVGIVVENKYVQYIEDIEPINDRIIRMTLNGKMPVTILGIYLPQAGRPEEEGELIAKQVDREIKKWKAKGPLYILGDMNARIQRAEGRREKEHIGKYTFEPETASSNRSEMVQKNRTRLINLCQTHGLRIMNTMFKKEKEKLATYAEVGTPAWWPKTIGYPYGFEQLDYILTTERWKNSVKNVEADPNANVTTRHKPVKARIKIKLKAIRASNKKRKNTESWKKKKKKHGTMN